MSYKSTRLLVEAINNQMTNMKKLLMQELATSALDGAQESWVELRKLVDELSEKADRPSIDDLQSMSVGDYVKTMKPLVRQYHQNLFRVDKLTACLCEDIEADGCVLIFIGDGKTVIRTAYNEDRPNAQMGVEAVVQCLEGMNQMLQQGIEEFENQAGIEVPEEAIVRSPPAITEEDPSTEDEAEEGPP